MTGFATIDVNAGTRVLQRIAPLHECGSLYLALPQGIAVPPVP
jgi:hypothetical protein